MRNLLVRGWSGPKLRGAVKSGVGEHVPRHADAVDDAQLRDAARARLLQRLAHTLRHDLNSPVQAALWAYDLLQRGIESHPDPNQRTKLLASLELGRREIARLQAAVRVFVSAAAPSEEPAAAFDLREVIDEIGRLTGAEASLRDVRLTFELPADSLVVTGMRAHVQLALLQLTLDALDGAGAGGTLAVHVTSPPSFATVCLVATPRGPAAIASKPAGASSIGAGVVDAVAASHNGHVRRRPSPSSVEVEFAIARG